LSGEKSMAKVVMKTLIFRGSNGFVLETSGYDEKSGDEFQEIIVATDYNTLTNIIDELFADKKGKVL
jgi:hypothetical protein